MGSFAKRLRFGALGPNCVHLCVDMQRMFYEDTEWRTPWMPRVLPKIVDLAAACPERTVFTRFIPAERAGEGEGSWRRYYRRWPAMTLEKLGRDMIELAPPLQRLVPPAAMFDKRVYSPWLGTGLHAALRGRAIDTLIVTGSETDVCVLATVLGAVDRGYRVVLATDAVCSSSDETHDGLLTLYEKRYSEQVEAVTSDIIKANWLDARGEYSPSAGE
jgi:nicotinamidase-related amidase